MAKLKKVDAAEAVQAELLRTIIESICHNSISNINLLQQVTRTNGKNTASLALMLDNSLENYAEAVKPTSTIECIIALLAVAHEITGHLLSKVALESLEEILSEMTCAVVPPVGGIQ